MVRGFSLSRMGHASEYVILRIFRFPERITIQNVLAAISVGQIFGVGVGGNSEGTSML